MMCAFTKAHAAQGIAAAIVLMGNVSALSETRQPPSSFPSITPSAWMAAAARHDVELTDLYAIALQESRRRRADGWMRAWPWTLNSPRSGPLYFETYEAALEKLTALIAEGEKNIDVGMMGINWYYNGHRARDPASLLEISNNIFIAAAIYREHLNRFGGDRVKAIARYHSGTKALGLPYAAAVIAIAEHLRKENGVHLALEESPMHNR